MPALTIGSLARAADVKIPTIRFYEQIGLLPEPDRSESDRRLYGEIITGRRISRARPNSLRTSKRRSPAWKRSAANSAAWSWPAAMAGRATAG